MSWHDRLQQALDARGKTWSDLVDATGLTEPSVYAWRPSASRRTTMINGDNAARVCAYLHINALWLFDEIGPSGLNANDPYPSHLFAATLEEIELISHLRQLSAAESNTLTSAIIALASQRQGEKPPFNHRTSA